MRPDRSPDELAPNDSSSGERCACFEYSTPCRTFGRTVDFPGKFPFHILFIILNPLKIFYPSVELKKPTEITRPPPKQSWKVPQVT